MRRHTKSAAQWFSPTDRRRLERALSTVREARLYRRIEAVLLVAEGQPISDADQRVRATRLSVRRWVKRYLAAHAATALADRPRQGRPHSAPRLTSCRLAAALAHDPRGCGYQATSWTVPLLRLSVLRRGAGMAFSAPAKAAAATSALRVGICTSTTRRVVRSPSVPTALAPPA